MEDSIDTIMAVRMTNPDSLKKQLRVVFANEEGVDAGGVQKVFSDISMHSFDLISFIKNSPCSGMVTIISC